ncbi:hypothetical protein [Haloquadratum walsbyi]|uniref:hypothetical protein n=1 Tax=Haloquadratum walsbyi TaxID=293091 RepID=UPI0031B620B3
MDTEDIPSAWRTYSTALDQRVRITTSREITQDVAVDLQAPGALTVQPDSGTRTVHVGDCEHLRSRE